MCRCWHQLSGALPAAGLHPRSTNQHTCCSVCRTHPLFTNITHPDSLITPHRPHTAGPPSLAQTQTPILLRRAGRACTQPHELSQPLSHKDAELSQLAHRHPPARQHNATQARMCKGLHAPTDPPLSCSYPDCKTPQPHRKYPLYAGVPAQVKDTGKPHGPKHTYNSWPQQASQAHVLCFVCFHAPEIYPKQPLACHPGPALRPHSHTPSGTKFWQPPLPHAREAAQW